MTTKPLRLNKRPLFADLGYRPHAGQLRVHDSHAPRRIVACGVRWGKTWCAAMEGLAAALEPRPRSVGWVVAPTYDLADRVFREIVIRAVEHLSHRVIAVRESEKRLQIKNMAGGISEVRAKSADNPVSLLGEGLDFVIIDEAARLKPTIWQSHLSQRLIDKRGWALLISTPRGKGWLYDLWRRGQGEDPDYESWNLPSWTNPLLDRALIEEERERLPERVFRQEYGGEFIEGAGSVFRNVRECATGEWQEPVVPGRYYAGLDLAKTEDYTVLVIVDKERQVVHFDRFQKIDWALQVDRIKVACDRFNRAEVYVDSTGGGEPVLESLRRAGVQAKPYLFTNRSKAALVDNVALMLERRELVLPRLELCPVLVDELEAFQYSISDAGTVRSGAPSGTHDDAVIGLALALWWLRPRHEVPQIPMAPKLFRRSDWAEPSPWSW